jgi:hypothetical protein
MRRLVLVFILTLFCLFTLSAGMASNLTSPEDFPLAKGNYWIYQGKVKWSLLNTPGMISTTLRVKMEVLETAQNGIYFVAQVKNYPLSLAWSDGRIDNSLVYIIGKRTPLSPESTSLYLIDERALSEEQLNQVSSFMKEGRGDISSLLINDNLWLDLPLKKNKAYGYGTDGPRPDYWYSWHVEYVRNTNLKKIKGIPAGACKTEYELAYRTGPDHQIIDYVPGIGMTHYEYVHHGSVSEMDMKLLEIHLQNK